MFWPIFIRYPRHKLRAEGFTLVELMVTVAIVAIMAAIALPSYQALVINSRMTTQASEFLTTLEFTRSEAVKRNTRVTMCKSNNGTSCLINAAADLTASWQPGWIVFIDGGTAGDIDGTDTILKVHGALIGGSTLVGNILVTNYVSYMSNGLAQQAGGGMQGGTFTLCSSNTAMAGRTIVLTTGTSRARITQTACS